LRNGAGGPDGPFALVEAETAIIPGQAALIDHPPHLTLPAMHHILVRHIEDGSGAAMRTASGSLMPGSNSNQAVKNIQEVQEQHAGVAPPRG